MVDVFISYSRTDLAAVSRLAHAVEAEGYEVWWDADLPPHLSYGDVITAKIGMAKAAIVVWSKDSAASEWVRAEADMARNQKKLVQTAIGDVMPPLPFNQIQFAEIGDWQGEADHPGWRKVKASLAELVGREPGPAHQPVRPIPAVAPPPTAAPSAGSKWPLYAGIGLGVLAVLAIVQLAMRDQRLEGEVAAEREEIEALESQAAAQGQPAAEDEAALEAVETEVIAPEPDVAAPAGLTPGIEVLPFSSERPLTAADLAPLGKAELWIARNEIFARNGRRFRDARLRQWFSRFSWYRPTSFEVAISPIEQRNVALIQAAERRFGG